MVGVIPLLTVLQGYRFNNIRLSENLNERNGQKYWQMVDIKNSTNIIGKCMKVYTAYPCLYSYVIMGNFHVPAQKFAIYNYQTVF